ncbi:hypothetical protein StoSoilB13_04960 [Arthrobacter sp. StoSoilB13]|nr:hypothetical protein StoSoilB13_04960 [Arthrobacter sp. StoSoilB13]
MVVVNTAEPPIRGIFGQLVTCGRGATQATCHDAPNGRGDEARRDRSSGRAGDAQGKRQCHDENYEGRRKVRAQAAEEAWLGCTFALHVSQ